MKHTDLAQLQAKIAAHFELADEAFHMDAGLLLPATRSRARKSAKPNPLAIEIDAIRPNRMIEYLEMGANLFAKLRPVGEFEMYLAYELVQLEWRFRQIHMLETETFFQAFEAFTEKLGRPMEDDELPRAQTFALVRDTNGPKIFEQLERFADRTAADFTRYSRFLEQQQKDRLLFEKSDSFDLSTCSGFRWFEEMLYLYSQVPSQQHVGLQLAA